MEVYMHCLPGNMSNNWKTIVYDFGQPDMFLQEGGREVGVGSWVLIWF